jgi:murein endopeptidase
MLTPRLGSDLQHHISIPGIAHHLADLRAEQEDSHRPRRYLLAHDRHLEVVRCHRDAEEGQERSARCRAGPGCGRYHRVCLGHVSGRIGLTLFTSAGCSSLRRRQ